VRFLGKRGQDPGSEGERLAGRFLRELGMRILQRNCGSRFGEIDIIARDGDEVVFVEVKTRTSGRWGEPVEAVTPAKVRRLRRAAEQFASRSRIRDYPLRFDVVTVLLDASGGGSPEIRHYPDAFSI